MLVTWHGISSAVDEWFGAFWACGLAPHPLTHSLCRVFILRMRRTTTKFPVMLIPLPSLWHELSHWINLGWTETVNFLGCRCCVYTVIPSQPQRASGNSRSSIRDDIDLTRTGAISFFFIVFLICFAFLSSNTKPRVMCVGGQIAFPCCA